MRCCKNFYIYRAVVIISLNPSILLCLTCKSGLFAAVLTYLAILVDAAALGKLCLAALTARVNHQNKLTHPHLKRNIVPAAVLTKSGQVPVNAAKQSSQTAAASVSVARHVNTAASRLNSTLPTTYFYFKAHSPVRRPFNQKSAAKTNNFNEKVNTAKVNDVTTVGPKAVVSASEGNWNNAVKSLACRIWRKKGNLIDHISKESGSYTLKIL
nr:hypothetical protein [Tanacetum cinerariifolium]